ncbi:MAG: hypothetical protein MUF64_02415 [Polyangiaceae bacterium]|nr:hypothetical protein [Polyangiaceae bacterium]
MHSRKLLIAAVGVATVNYLAGCETEEEPPTTGNLPAPIAGQGGTSSGASGTGGQAGGGTAGTAGSAGAAGEGGQAGQEG